MINKIKNLIISNNLDGYIIPKNDEFFTEYSKTNKLHIVANFTGSAGFILILKKTTICLLMADIQFKQKNSQEEDLIFMRYHMYGQKIF